MKIKVCIFSLLLPGCTLLPPAVSNGLTATNVGVWGVTDKSPTDHALSYTTNTDCKTLRIFTDSKVCQDAIYKQEDVFTQRSRN